MSDPLAAILAKVRSWESASPQEKAQYQSKPPAPVAPPPQATQPDDYATNLHRTVSANLASIGVDPAVLGPAPAQQSSNTYRLPGMGAAGFPEIRQAAPKQDEGGGFLSKIGGALSDYGDFAKGFANPGDALLHPGRTLADSRDALGSAAGVLSSAGHHVAGPVGGSFLDSSGDFDTNPLHFAANVGSAEMRANPLSRIGMGLANQENPYGSGANDQYNRVQDSNLPVGAKVAFSALSDPQTYMGGPKAGLGFAAGSGVGAQLSQDAPGWAQGPIQLGAGIAGATLAHNPGLALKPVRAGVRLNEAITERIPTAERAAESFAPRRGAVDAQGNPLTFDALGGGSTYEVRPGDPLYHGSPNPIEGPALNPSLRGDKALNLGPGAYLASDSEMANWYVRDRLSGDVPPGANVSEWTPRRESQLLEWQNWVTPEEKRRIQDALDAAATRPTESLGKPPGPAGVFWTPGNQSGESVYKEIRGYAPSGADADAFAAKVLHDAGFDGISHGREKTIFDPSQLEPRVNQQARQRLMQGDEATTNVLGRVGGGAPEDFASPEERANLVKALRDAGISDADLVKEGLIEKPAAGGRSSSPPSAPAPAMSAKPAFEPKPFDIPGQPAGAVAAEGDAAASRAALDFAQGEHSLRLGENVAGAEIGQGRAAQVGAYRAAFQDALNRGATPQEAGAQALEAARGGMRQTFAEGIQAEHFPALEAQAASEYAAGTISDYEHMQIAQDLRDLQAGKKWGLQPAEYRLWQKVFGGEVADKMAASAGGGKAPVWAAKNPATTMPMDLGDQTVAVQPPMFGESGIVEPDSGQYLAEQAGTSVREIQPRLLDNPDAPALGLDVQHPLTADEIANPQRGRSNPFSTAINQTSDVLREIATFGHAGIIGLHGFARMLTNPKAWAEEIAALPKAWRDPAYVQQAEQAGRQAMEEMQAGLTPLMERAGLRIAGPNTGELGGSILRKIPGVGNALRRNEAGYTAVTTAFRRGKAMELVRLQQDANEAAGLPRAITQAQANQIANYTNHFTLTTTSTSNPLLNAILWTPKMLGAQVGLLRDVAGKGPIGLQARKDFAQILGETVTSVFAANLAASGGKDLWGPGLGRDVPQDRDELRRLVGDSSFGKVQIGDQKFSPFGPFDAQVRTAFKVSADVAKGDPAAVQGDAGQWFRNHMSPIMSLATDLITGKDWRGEDVSPASLAKGHLLPIASQQSADLVDNLIHGNAQNSLGDTLGLALSAKSSPVTAADQLDEIAQRQFGQNFFNIEPFQQDQVKQAHADLWKAAVDAGNTQRQQSIAKKAELATQQDAANAELLAGKITPKDFANQTHDRKMQLLGAESIIYGDKKVKPPTDPAKFDAFIAAGQTPRDRLFRAIDVNTGADGQPDWDKVDAWKAKQSTADQAYIDRNTGLGGTPLERLRSKLSAEYNALPIYRGYTADQGRAIDTLVTDAKARAKGGRSQAPDDTQVLSAMRQLAKGRGIAESSPGFVAARRAVLGILSQDTGRASYRKAHPEYALVGSQAALTPQAIAAIQKKMGAIQ